MFRNLSSLFILVLLSFPSSHGVPGSCLEIDWDKVLVQQNIELADCRSIANCIQDLFTETRAAIQEFLYIKDLVVKLAESGIEVISANSILAWSVYSISSLLVSYTVAVDAKFRMINASYIPEELDSVITATYRPLKLIEKYMNETEGFKKLCEVQEELMDMLKEPFAQVRKIREDIKEDLKKTEIEKYRVVEGAGWMVITGVIVFYQRYVPRSITIQIYTVFCARFAYYAIEIIFVNEDTKKILMEERSSAKLVEKQLQAVRSSIRVTCVEAKIVGNSMSPFLMIEKMEKK